MGLVDVILEHGSLTEREQSIRTFLIQHPDRLYNMSARDLGEATYSSAAAVTRFCKKLGCRGYQDFRIRFLQDVREKERKSDAGKDTGRKKTDDIFSFQMEKQAELCLRAVSAVVQDNSPHCIEKAALMIHEAEYVDIYAYDLGVYIADYAVYRFMQCGKTVRLYSEPFMRGLSAFERRDGHLALILSYTGANDRLSQLAKTLSGNEIPILCFTGKDKCRLSKASDQVLLLPTGRNGKGFLREEGETVFTTAFKYLVDNLADLELENIRQVLRERNGESRKKWRGSLWNPDADAETEFQF